MPLDNPALVASPEENAVRKCVSAKRNLLLPQRPQRPVEQNEAGYLSAINRQVRFMVYCNNDE